MSNADLQNINIVCSGGGMTGGFTAGLLCDMFERIDQSSFRVTFYCVSAGVPSVLYYLSHGLNNPKEKVWVNELSKESNKVNNGILKIDIDGIIKVFKDNPLNFENILNNKDEIIFSVFNVSLNKSEFVSSKKRENHLYLGDFDLYDAIKASIAVPVAYGKVVKLGKHEYCDADPMGHFLIPKNDNKTIFIIQNKNFRMSKFLHIIFFVYSLFSKDRRYYRKFSVNYINIKKLYKKVKTLVKFKKAILLEPSHNLKGGINLAMTEKDLRYNFLQGQKILGKNILKIQDFLIK